MGYYAEKKPRDQALEEFPGLSQEELDEVDEMYEKYLFYQGDRGGREVWTTCCHENYYIENDRGPKELTGKHGDVIQCPFCGETVTVKCMGRLRDGSSVKQYIPVVFLHRSEDGETVWAQGYWTTRNLMKEPTGKTLFMPTRCYRFRRGEWRMWEEGWSGGMVPCGDKWVKEPFRENGPYSPYEDYFIVGYENLEGSFLKYAGYDEPILEWKWEIVGKRKDLMRYLAMASLYPTQVEMLRKAGVDEIVKEYLYYRRKCHAVFRWKETDPRKAFGMTKEELREFLTTTKKKVSVLQLYRICGRALTLTQCQGLEDRVGFYQAEKLLSTAKTVGVPFGKLLAKLEAWSGGKYRYTAVDLWVDYIDAAGKLGWDLTNPLIQLPRDLEEKHDEATQAVKVEADRIANEQAAALYEKLWKRYGFEDGEFCIVPPKSASEIVREGKALRHCVGGYAQRHIEGKTTILFLRSRSAPATPYVTIEMHGTELAQIHGYKNDVHGTSPRKTHKDFVETWLAWVKAGSERDKDGRPKLPKKKKEEAA